MAQNLPYLLSPGTLTRAFEKIRKAATPERFSGDFVTTVIGIKGGAGQVLIPFFKRAGLVNSDGTPTELYNQFRNSAQSKKAAAAAFQIAYKNLYERNEFIHQAADDDVKGAIVEITGSEPDSRVVQAIFGTFKAFKTVCDFEGKLDLEEKAVKNGREDHSEKFDEETPIKHQPKKGVGLNLSYTINLNLPATDDIKVFDAIFRSLKDNLLKD